jgi:ribosome-associated toxin RatA of RatAB toxin-antitoxin module
MPIIEVETQISAPLDHVYTIAKAIETFASFIPDVESIKIVERDDSTGKVVADWVGLIPEFKQKIRWTEEDHWDDSAHTCTFHQVKGEYKVFEGVWLFEQLPSGTLFKSTLNYDLEIPLIGALIKKLVAKKVLDNITQILGAIKDRAESTLPSTPTS